jgi:hypothetical protein
MLVPRPLHVRVVGLTLLEPAEVEPECSDLCRWLRKKVMGTRTNSWVMNLLRWITAAFMSAAAVGLVVTWD